MLKINNYASKGPNFEMFEDDFRINQSDCLASFYPTCRTRWLKVKLMRKLSPDLCKVDGYWVYGGLGREVNFVLKMPLFVSVKVDEDIHFPSAEPTLRARTDN